jgi:hypothetical protein
LATKEAELVGEYVGEQGRRPNPVILQAIRNGPPIFNLTHLQQFLGMANYVRPHAGPAYARIAHPLRTLLKPGAASPLTKEQHEAVEGLKALMVDTHRLAVPDGRAAVEAAAAWNAGEPPTGRLLENGADTSKTAIWGSGRAMSH